MLEAEFDKRVALVTGGSSGIGLAIARLLAAKGAHVWLAARNRDRLKTALASVKSARLSPEQRCGVIAADVTDIKQAESAVSEVSKACGAPDILINSAGDVFPCLFHEMDVNIARCLMEVNYFGMVHMTHACLPAMIQHRSGHIVNISSVYGFVGGYGYAAYCASKFAVRGFSDALRAELKPLGISVSIVFPQDTDTPNLEREDKLKTPMLKALNDNPVMTPEAVARSVVRGISRKRYVIIPGGQGRFLYRLTGMLGGGTYHIMDYMIKNAQKKVEKAR